MKFRRHTLKCVCVFFFYLFFLFCFLFCYLLKEYKHFGSDVQVKNGKAEKYLSLCFKFRRSA